MHTPEAVAAMRRLHQLGWGIKRIAGELDCSAHTVRHSLRQGEWRPSCRPVRHRLLRGLDDWLAASFRQHRDNADVVRQELQRVHGLQVSLRTMERAVQPWRQLLEAEARATVRIGEEPVRVRLFVARWGFRAGRSWRRSTTSGRRPGWRAWSGPFGILAGCRRRC